MNKFLRLVRESDPAQTSQFTIELKDSAGKVIDSIESSGDSFERFREVKELFGIEDDVPGKVGTDTVEYLHPSEDESTTAAEVVDDAGEQYDNEKNVVKKLRDRRGKEAARLSQEYKSTVLDDAIEEIKNSIADYGNNK
jgi:hypothetical protein